MSIKNIQLKLTQKINIKGSWIIVCSLLPDARIVLSCYCTNIVTFFNKENYSRKVKIKQDPVLLIQFIIKIAIALLSHLDGEVIDV